MHLPGMIEGCSFCALTSIALTGHTLTQEYEFLHF